MGRKRVRFRTDDGERTRNAAANGDSSCGASVDSGVADGSIPSCSELGVSACRASISGSDASMASPDGDAMLMSEVSVCAEPGIGEKSQHVVTAEVARRIVHAAQESRRRELPLDSTSCIDVIALEVYAMVRTTLHSAPTLVLHAVTASVVSHHAAELPGVLRCDKGDEWLVADKVGLWILEAAEEFYNVDRGVQTQSDEAILRDPEVVSIGRRIEAGVACLRMVDRLRRRRVSYQIYSDVCMGEELYALISLITKPLASKVTGMMMELDESELRRCLFELEPIEAAARVYEWCRLAKEVLDEVDCDDEVHRVSYDFMEKCLRQAKHQRSYDVRPEDMEEEPPEEKQDSKVLSRVATRCVSGSADPDRA